MTVPALVAGAVEAGLVAKEALARRRRGAAPAGFTDDGFPLGLAFLLKVSRLHPIYLSYGKHCHNSDCIPLRLPFHNSSPLRLAFQPIFAGFHDSSFRLLPPLLKAGASPLAQVLEQETAFDSLQWFEAVGGHYAAEAAAVAERPGSGGPPSPAGLAARLLDGLGSTLRGVLCCFSVLKRHRETQFE